LTSGGNNLNDFPENPLIKFVGTVENHRKKMVLKTAHFCETRKNHGKITAVYIAANLLKLMVFNSRKIYILGKTHTTMTSGSHIPPVSNKALGLW